MAKEIPIPNRKLTIRLVSLRRDLMMEILDRLLASDDPVIRFKTLKLQPGAENEQIRRARERIPELYFVRTLLSQRGQDGRIPHHAYAKWQGAHWVLALLAELGYPAGDLSLIPLREQVLGWLLSESHYQQIKTISGRVRRCASQEANALYSLLSLGLADERCDELARRLAAWQWPDRGWNCDRHPEAANSSYNESLLPFRALSLHARISGSEVSLKAAQHAAEVFLKRRLFKRLRDGEVMDASFVRLHYPSYWHYDILSALKVMAETGFIHEGALYRCLGSAGIASAAGWRFSSRRKILPGLGANRARLHPRRLGRDEQAAHAPIRHPGRIVRPSGGWADGIHHIAGACPSTSLTASPLRRMAYS